SNLCTEILQNQGPTRMIREVISGDQIVTTRQAGDFVVCNLSSINLGRAAVAAEGQGDLISAVLERLVPIQVRMLDNVIDLNELPVPQATITNRKYRAIGLGTFGWHHLLALKGVDWNSAEAEEFSDALYERINYLAVQASMELAKEKGTYPVFAGSDWHTGAYFRERGVAGPGGPGGGQRPAQRLAARGGAQHVDRADRGQYRVDRPDLLGVLLRGEEGLPASGGRARAVAGDLAVLREGRVEAGPVRLGAAERAPPAPHRPVDQLQLLRAFHHPCLDPAGSAHDGVAGRAEDHLLRALERYRYRGVRMVFELTR